MRVLVTGHNGHMGGAIAAHLVAQGWQVVGLDRTVRAGNGLVQQVQADLGSPSLIEQVLAATPPCTAIVHAAAALDKDLYAPAVCLTNCLGTQQVLQLARHWKAHSLVYISSLPIIGIPHQLPITEDHPANPPTAYHAAKLFGEHLTRLAGQAGLAAATLRLTSPVGPGMANTRIFPVFVKRALAHEPLQLAGRGQRQQNYVDVRDAAAAVAICLRNPVAGLFNIAGQTPTSNLELAQACIRVLGSSSEIQFTGQPDPQEDLRWDVSIAKAAEQLGYRPQYGIEQSIRAVGADYALGVH